MKALLDDTVAVTADAAEGPIRDALLIASTQRLQHYEIAGYSAARTMAEVMGLPAVTRLLARTLKEERSVTQVLAQIADRSVNKAAAVEWRAEQVHREAVQRRRPRAGNPRQQASPARASRKRRKT